MSQENRRTIAERAGLRWPSMAPRTMRWILRLPLGSRVRTAMLQRFARPEALCLMDARSLARSGRRM